MINKEIIIGLNADLASTSSLSGIAIKRGMELAVNEINENGGVLGKTLKIVARNNSGISAHGIDNMKYFAGLENLGAVLSGIYSPIALAELPIIHKEKIIFLDPWAAATGIVENDFQPNYVFRVSVRDEYAGPFLVKEALKKYNRIALLLVNDGWGKSNFKAMTKALADRQQISIAVEWFNWGEKDMASHLDRIEKARADVILMVAGVFEGSSIVREMAGRENKIPIISHWGITGGKFRESVGPTLKNIDLKFLQSFSFMLPGNAKTKKIIQKYFEAYNIDHPGEIIAPVGTAHAYDLVHLLALAMKQAGTTDSPAVRDALEHIKTYDGLLKNYSPPFTEKMHDALDADSFFLAKYNEKGYIVPIIEQE